jgi:hypothetical protein
MTSHFSAEQRLHSTDSNESVAHDHWADLSGLPNWRETLCVLLWTHPYAPHEGFSQGVEAPRCRLFVLENGYPD